MRMLRPMLGHISRCHVGRSGTGECDKYVTVWQPGCNSLITVLTKRNARAAALRHRTGAWRGWAAIPLPAHLLTRPVPLSGWPEPACLIRDYTAPIEPASARPYRHGCCNHVATVWYKYHSVATMLPQCGTNVTLFECGSSTVLSRWAKIKPGHC